VDVARRLDTHAHPDVDWPWKAYSHLGQAVGPLRENLESVPVCGDHGVKNLGNEPFRNVLVEQVTHGVHEDSPGLTPSERQPDKIGLERDLEAVSIPGLTHGSQSVRHPLGIAVLASRADLCAARNGIPCAFGPLD
jgi:hypothetical protein